MRSRVVISLTVGLLALTSPAAYGHDDLGVLALVGQEAGGATAVTYEVSFVYSQDREPVTDASITVVAEQPNQPPLAPVPMAATGDPGRYRVTIEFPAAGSWTVRFAALTPRATLEQVHVVEASTSSSSAGGSTSTTRTLELRPAPEDEEDGAWPSIAAAAVVATMVVLLGAAAVHRRRRR